MWKSFDPTGSNYAAHYNEAQELGAVAGDGAEENPDAEWMQLDGSWVAGYQGHVVGGAAGRKS